MERHFTLLAESGSTKTDWFLWDGHGKLYPFSSSGLNPNIVDSKKIAETLREELLSAPKFPRPHEIKEIHFYGAGCSDAEACKIVEFGLASVFGIARITVESDLLAAARATCGREPGICIILGTGSNACEFDGKEISRKTPSLGYVLGDEGSGSWLGKQLIRDLVYGILPAEISHELKKRKEFKVDSILQHVYRTPFPNRYLANFTHVLEEFRNDRYVSDLLRRGFSEFIKFHVLPSAHQVLPLHIVGSVGFIFEKELREAFMSQGLRISSLQKSPSEGLLRFHGFQI